MVLHNASLVGKVVPIGIILAILKLSKVVLLVCWKYGVEHTCIVVRAKTVDKGCSVLEAYVAVIVNLRSSALTSLCSDKDNAVGCL